MNSQFPIKDSKEVIRFRITDLLRGYRRKTFYSTRSGECIARLIHHMGGMAGTW